MTSVAKLRQDLADVEGTIRIGSPSGAVMFAAHARRSSLRYLLAARLEEGSVPGSADLHYLARAAYVDIRRAYAPRLFMWAPGSSPAYPPAGILAELFTTSLMAPGKGPSVRIVAESMPEWSGSITSLPAALEATYRAIWTATAALLTADNVDAEPPGGGDDD